MRSYVRMGLGLGLGLRLGVGQPPGLPEACHETLGGRPEGHLVPCKPNGLQSGSRAARQELEPQPPIRGGAVTAGTQNLGRRCLRGPLAGRQAKALSAVGCEEPGVGGAYGGSLARGRGLKERGGKKPTAPGISRRCPIHVITSPDPASFSRSDEIGRVKCGMAVDGGGCSPKEPCAASPFCSDLPADRAS